MGSYVSRSPVKEYQPPVENSNSNPAVEGGKEEQSKCKKNVRRVLSLSGHRESTGRRHSAPETSPPEEILSLRQRRLALKNAKRPIEKYYMGIVDELPGLVNEESESFELHRQSSDSQYNRSPSGTGILKKENGPYSLRRFSDPLAIDPLLLERRRKKRRAVKFEEKVKVCCYTTITLDKVEAVSSQPQAETNSF